MGLKLTFFSDTHNRHKVIEDDLPGGHILFFTGDCSERGGQHEVHNFMKWFGNIKTYDYKVMIAGNHDRFIEWQPDHFKSMLKMDELYGDFIYLQDEAIELCGLNIYGSPWQPWFHDWAFNLPREGEELKKKWDDIPENTDILLTHGPPKKILDWVKREPSGVGCELLNTRVFQVNPTIHAFGHVHECWGEKKINDIIFINGTIMDSHYTPSNKPITLDYDIITKEVTYDY